MANNTLTFALGGWVAIEDFEHGISLLRRLVSALSHGGRVTWVIEDLQPGSAITTLRASRASVAVQEAVVG